MVLCNILILLYDIGTYDVINATAYPNGNSICVECVFQLLHLLSHVMLV